jgi:TonB family protein
VKGSVTLSLDIDDAGKVTSAEVVSGPHPDYGMNAACEQAAKAMTFSPPKDKGVSVSTTWTFLMALNPPPPKPKVPHKAHVGLILESKAHVARFVVKADGDIVFDAPLEGSMGRAVRETRALPLLPGNHHFVATATFQSGRTIQYQWTQALLPGQQAVFNVWVPAFGNSIKMKRLQ